METTGLRRSPLAGLPTGLRVQLAEPLGAPTRHCPSQSFLHARVWQVGKSLRLPPAPPDIPGQSRQASRTGAGRRSPHPTPVPTLGKRLARRAPPGAGPWCGPRPSPASWAGAERAACAGRAPHPRFLQRRHPAAAALQEGGPAAPVPPHPRAPRVRAPGLQKLPGWRRRDFWAAPPSPATTLRSQRSESPWRLCCSIQDPAPRLPAELRSTPAGRCPEAAPPARVPHSPFPVNWDSVIAPGLFSHRPRPPGESSRRAFLRRQHLPETLPWLSAQHLHQPATLPDSMGGVALPWLSLFHHHTSAHL